MCEYFGELLRDEQAEKRVMHDDYLLDIFVSDETGVVKEGDLVLDAGQYGGIARFLNHSCDPNLKR